MVDELNVFNNFSFFQDGLDLLFEVGLACSIFLNEVDRFLEISDSDAGTLVFYGPFLLSILHWYFAEDMELVLNHFLFWVAIRQAHVLIVKVETVFDLVSISVSIVAFKWSCFIPEAELRSEVLMLEGDISWKVKNGPDFRLNWFFNCHFLHLWLLLSYFLRAGLSLHQSSKT
jgi:hypothetical protein